MENYKAKHILISAHPKKLAEEVKRENPKDIVHFFFDSEDQTFETNDVALKDYDFIFLTDEDYQLLLPKLSDLGRTHLCVIYTDLESEFFLIPPGGRIDSYCFGLFDDWLSHIYSVLNPEQLRTLKHLFFLTRKTWEQHNEVTFILPHLFQGERISKNLEEHIKFILRELISNSYLHTKTSETVIEFEKRTSDVCLRITDFCGEFPKERFISTLFRQKRVVETNNLTKGAGIGLFLVAQIANELNVKTSKNGTSIEVVIPIRKIAGQASFYKKILSYNSASDSFITFLRKNSHSVSTSNS